MLEKTDFSKQLSKEEYKLKMSVLKPRLGELQRQCRQLKIPVMIVFEGFDAAGKGFHIGRLIQNLDPRGFRVYTIKKETEEERMHPFLWRFWTKTPQRGRIAVFDGSWYQKVLAERFEKKTKKTKLAEQYAAIRSFEKQLTDDGTVLVKLLLVIDKQEQKKRFRKLLKNKETAWRVTKEDLEHNEHYETYSCMMDEMLLRTNDAYAPWTIIESTDKQYAAVKIYTQVIQALEEKINTVMCRTKSESRNPGTEDESTEQVRKISEGEERKYGKDVLARADLSLSYSKEEYRKRLKKAQDKIKRLHGELYRRRIPVVIAFEGWDAAGKGGAIKRLTEKMDSRGFEVIPVAAPNDLEKSHHYLWRFWKSMPKNGHIAIFDRTWYGRVMVERIEGFCSRPEWQRAYREIREMEKELTDHGTIVLKFWMQIDKDEQKKRFEERQTNPQKQWKITEEDWRNRAKWDIYESAVCEMIDQTSTDYAPWIIVEGNNKYYARIKVLESVIAAVEERLRHC